jgi:hypothetical protein
MALYKNIYHVVVDILYAFATPGTLRAGCHPQRGQAVISSF